MAERPAPAEAGHAWIGHVTGLVIHGAGRGTGLGFPTANIATDDPTDVPASGIYSGWLVRAGDQQVHAATVSVGSNPTFSTGPEVHVEVFCHDLDTNLYGERVRVWFVTRLRDTLAFSSPEAMVRAAHRDVTRSRAVLCSASRDRVLAELGHAAPPAGSASQELDEP